MGVPRATARRVRDGGSPVIFLKQCFDNLQECVNMVTYRLRRSQYRLTALSVMLLTLFPL